MLEVSRQHFLSELVGFIDDKTSPVEVPLDGGVICRILPINQ